MIKTILLLVLLPFVSCSQKQSVLQQDYSFLVADGVVTKLHQSNDTLYELKCYIDRPCQPRPSKHFKILSSNKSGEFTILKLERLDSILLTSNPYPITRHSILALKNIDKNQLGYLIINLGLTRQQLDTVQTISHSPNDKIFFTYFSDTYLRELSVLKKISTKEDANIILESVKSDKYKALTEKYLKTETHDLYASGLSAELLSRACIENGFSPIGAGQALNKLIEQ